MLHSRLVCKVVWIIEHAEVVGTSSSVAPPASSSPSCIHQLSSSDIWAAVFSPLRIDHPSISCTRRTCYSLLSPPSLRPTRTRQTVSSIPSIPLLQHLNVGEGACIDIIPCRCIPLWSVQNSILQGDNWDSVLQYRNLLKICPWVMKLRSSSMRGMGVFSKVAIFLPKIPIAIFKNGKITYILVCCIDERV